MFVNDSWMALMMIILLIILMMSDTRRILQRSVLDGKWLVARDYDERQRFDDGDYDDGQVSTQSCGGSAKENSRKDKIMACH